MKLAANTRVACRMSAECAISTRDSVKFESTRILRTAPWVVSDHRIDMHMRCVSMSEQS